MTNLIKTPQEILMEQAGVPHMAGGGALSAGARQLFDTAVKRFRAVNNRAPNASELQQLEQHAMSFSAPTSTGSGLNEARLQQTPAKNLLVNEEGMAYAPLYGKRGTQTTPEQARGYNLDPFGMESGNVRAREALTVPSQKPFETRDPFLTEAMTGRAPTRTRQKPFTVSLDDLTTQRAAEESAGKFHGATDTTPGGYPAQSTTPSADFFAEQSAAIENAKLPSNIRSILREQLGREPTPDEINAFIANLNVAGANYTGKGASVFGERPQYGPGRLSKDLSEQRAQWMQEAIDSGMSPSAVTAKPAELEKHYPKLLEEMQMGPNPKKEGGRISPTQMAHEMLVLGKNPQKFAGGRSTGPMSGNDLVYQYVMSQPEEKYRPTAQAYEPDFSERTTDTIASGLEKMGINPLHARGQAEKIGTAIDVGSLAFDPLAIPRGAYELSQGDLVGGGADIAFGAPGAYATYKATQAAAPKVMQAAKVLPKVGGALSRFLGPVAMALTPSELGDSSLDAWNKRKANK